MSPLDRDLLAERAIFMERHLKRVAERLPADADDLRPASDASDAVVLHLWQATQIAIDLATAACVRLELGTPRSYADAFARLEEAGVIAPDLARRLVKAAGFRNVVAHAYERLDMRRVHEAARNGPADSPGAAGGPPRPAARVRCHGRAGSRPGGAVRKRSGRRPGCRWCRPSTPGPRWAGAR